MNNDHLTSAHCSVLNPAFKKNPVLSIIQDAQSAGYRTAQADDFVDLFMIDEDGQVDGLRVFKNGTAADLFAMQANPYNHPIITSAETMRSHLGI